MDNRSPLGKTVYVDVSSTCGTDRHSFKQTRKLVLTALSSKVSWTRRRV
jgi:hypothetical protein